MDNLNNLYEPVKERIFTQLKSKSISQKEFARSIKVSAETITAWKAGRNYSFMKKLKSIASVLNTSEIWLLTGKNTAPDAGTRAELEELADAAGVHLLDLIGADAAGKETIPIPDSEKGPANARFEIDPALLASAAELMQDLMTRLEADAAALARLDSPEARDLAQERLESAKVAESLYYFFGTR